MPCRCYSEWNRKFHKHPNTYVCTLVSARYFLSIRIAEWPEDSRFNKSLKPQASNQLYKRERNKGLAECRRNARNGCMKFPVQRAGESVHLNGFATSIFGMARRTRLPGHDRWIPSAVSTAVSNAEGGRVTPHSDNPRVTNHMPIIHTCARHPMTTLTNFIRYIFSSNCGKWNAKLFGVSPT